MVDIVITEETAVVVVTVAEAGPPGAKGDKGDPGTYDGAVADASPDPVLLFDNALI